VPSIIRRLTICSLFFTGWDVFLPSLVLKILNVKPINPSPVLAGFAAGCFR
jgi:hypothetical protein